MGFFLILRYAMLTTAQFNHPLDTNSQPKSVQLAYQRTKTKAYHDVLDIIFQKTRQASRSGKVWKFGDGKTRRGFPDILIKSLDMQEAYAVCSCRAYPANFPCVKCLVPFKEQHNLHARFELRTKENMGAIYEAVEAETRKTYKNDLLKGVGLHEFKASYPIIACFQSLIRTPQPFDWGFRFSDPYSTYRYDTCHNDSLGLWGKHLWKMLLQVLDSLGLRAEFNKRFVQDMFGSLCTDQEHLVWATTRDGRGSSILLMWKTSPSRTLTSTWIFSR
jgi:hypothetical protein